MNMKETEQQIERRLMADRLGMLHRAGIAVEMSPRELREYGLDPNDGWWSQTPKPPAHVGPLTREEAVLRRIFAEDDPPEDDDSEEE